MLIDTHAHINYLKNPEVAIKEANASGVSKIIVPGVIPEEFDDIINLAEKYESVYVALGVHPSEASKFNKDVAGRMIELASHKKVIGIGEIGLDYYWDKTQVELQKEVFLNQLDIANLLSLPVIVHDREAHLDSFNIIKQSGVKKVLMHCFSGSVEFAKECVKEGFMIAIGGVVTFKNAKKMKDVVREIPISNIVLETDCPYLTPHPFRGEENSPKYLSFVAKEIANIKDMTYDDVMELTSQNALEFFNLRGV